MRKRDRIKGGGDKRERYGGPFRVKQTITLAPTHCVVTVAFTAICVGE